MTRIRLDMMRAVPLLVIFAGSRAFVAASTPAAAVIVGRSAEGQPWTDAATEARAGDVAELAVVLTGKGAGWADDAVTPLVLAGRRVPDGERRPFAELGRVEVRWSTVEPHAWRDDGNFHSNVSTDRGTFGKWLGY